MDLNTGLLLILAAVLCPVVVKKLGSYWTMANLNRLTPFERAAAWFGLDSIMYCWLPLLFGGMPSAILSVLSHMLFGALIGRNIADPGRNKQLNPQALGAFVPIAGFLLWFAIMYAVSSNGSEIRSMFNLNPDPPPEFWERCKGTDCDGVGVGYALGKYMFLFIGIPIYASYAICRGVAAGRSLSAAVNQSSVSFSLER